MGIKIFGILILILNKIIAPESNLIPFDDSSENAKNLLEKYANQIEKAVKDNTNYTSLTGILNTTEGRAMYYYSKNPPLDYSTEFRTTYRIRLKVFFQYDKNF